MTLLSFINCKSNIGPSGTFKPKNVVYFSQDLLYAVKSESPYEAYLDTLSNLDLSHLEKELKTREQKLAFWINLYNALVQIKLEKDKYGFENKSKFFGSKNFNIGGNNVSLDNIEHGILRGSQLKYGLGYIKKLWAPGFEQRFRLKILDYRIHFTMNCGASSCPTIAFYSPEKIDEQLELAESVFMNANSEYNLTENTVEVSKILQWFKGDFGGDKGIISILINNNIIPDNTNPKITFKEYDWTLENKKYE
jgi:hypothetical protein